MILHEEIFRFLQEQELYCNSVEACGHNILECTLHHGRKIAILPLSITSQSLREAEETAESAKQVIQCLIRMYGDYPLIITEDRWRAQPRMMQSRLLAHIEIFTQVYARNCEVRKIDKKTANDFLEENHSYGGASCRYRYGLYLKRHTGHNAEDERHIGELVAVATFSNARRWIKGEKTIRSYEWTRYAALPHIRICGGMGKLLKTFIEEVQPDDIMTYADLEWSEGKVYEALGFMPEGIKSPVSFTVDTNDWSRDAIKSDGSHGTSDCKFHTNLGSNKYRLKLTDYQ